MNPPPKSLRKRYLRAILPILGVLFFVSFAGAVLESLQNTKKQTQDVREFVRDAITVNLDVLQDMNGIYDRLFGHQITEKLGEFENTFNQAGNIPDRVLLEELKSSWGGEWDLFVIDSEETVVLTTYAPDMGLDFRKIARSFAERLEKIRSGNSIVLDKIAFEVAGNRSMKYGYMPSRDKSYLLEVGLAMPLDDPLFNPINPEYIGSLYEGIDRDNISIQIFQPSLLKKENPDLYQIRRDMRKQDMTCRENWEWKAGILNTYIIYRPRTVSSYPTPDEYFIRITYSLDSVIRNLQKAISVRMLYIAALMVFAVIMVLRIIKSLTKPLEKMIQEIGIIASGNWSFPITQPLSRETFKLKQSVEHLVMNLLNEKVAAEVRERKYRLAVEASRDVIFEWYLHEHSLFFSPNAASIIGADPGKRKGRALEQWFYNLVTPRSRQEWKALVRKMHEGSIRQISIELELKIEDQDEKWLLLRGGVEEEAGQNRFIGILADISLSRKRQKTIETLAYTNRVSNRSNLQAFYDRPAGLQASGVHYGLVMIDLDDFSRINTAFGHVVGDEVLRGFCRRLDDNILSLKEEEAWDIYHIYMDGFLLLVEGLENAEIVKQKILALYEKLCKGIYLALEREFYFTASMGAVVIPGEQFHLKDELIRKADIALMQAKNRGKNTLVFYKEKFSAGYQGTYDMIHKIWEGMHNNTLNLVYQPIVDSEGQEPVGFEALLRTGSDKSISPAAYIKAAEDSGLIHPLGLWIIQEALKQIKRMNDAGLSFRYISINISPLQFRELDFPWRMEQACRDNGVSPSQIQIEVTETALMESADRMIRIIGSLKELGFRIALDDFGTGYSSLDYLAHLPIDAIKIEKKMTAEVQQNVKVRRVVNLILQIARELSLEVIAEGVEDWEHVRWMVDHGCNHHQGYFYSRPLDSGHIPGYLSER